MAAKLRVAAKLREGHWPLPPRDTDGPTELRGEGTHRGGACSLDHFKHQTAYKIRRQTRNTLDKYWNIIENMPEENPAWCLQAVFDRKLFWSPVLPNSNPTTLNKKFEVCRILCGDLGEIYL